MQLQEIDVFIDEYGEVKIEVRGVKGGSCLDLTKALELALGGQVVARDMSAEYYEEVAVEIENRQQQKSG